MQLVTAKNIETTEDDYLEVIGAKTAALFAAAAEVGAAIAERPKSEAAALRSYGRNLGIAFQLVDDALDYSGEPAMMARASATISARARSRLPVVLCYRRGSEEEREFWQRRSRTARRRRRSRRSDRADGAAQCAVRHGGARATLWRDRPRCAGDLPRGRRQGGAARGRSSSAWSDRLDSRQAGSAATHQLG